MARAGNPGDNTMKRLLYILILCLPLGVEADTLHVTDLGFTTVYVQIADQVDDSSMIASGSQRVGNLYIDRVTRTDTLWVECDGMYMAVPIEYDISIVVQRFDLDQSGTVDISDLMEIIDYMFGG